MTSYKNSETTPPIMQGAPPPPEWRLPRIDWDRPPWNRWAFQRVSEILPTAPIRRGATVANLSADHQDIGDIRFAGSTGEITVRQMIEDTYTDGLFIWLDGKVIHESYYNGMDRRTLHLAQSVSKSITATAGAALIEEGLLDPLAPITDVLPELAETAWNGATLRQVMDMASGARFVEDYDVRDSDVGKMDYACGWKPAPDGQDASDWPTCIWDQITGLKVQEAPHGSRFLYRSIETDVMAHAMERAAGARLPQIISDRLWAPMGAEEDANITVDPSGYGLACGGISACLRDFGRFGVTLLNDGLVNGRRVIPKAWIDDIRTGDHGLFSDDGRKYFANGRYRNQFWIEDADTGSHVCLGVFGQMIYVAPDTGLVAVKLSTWPEFQNAEYLLDGLAGVKAVAAAFRG